MPAPIRASTVHAGEDIRQILRSVAAVHEATRRATSTDGGEYGQGYSDGFIDGLRALAEALGIPFDPGSGNVALGVRWDY